MSEEFLGTGFFGKLPGNGDFVARGLPGGARPLLDRWLTARLAALARAPERWPVGGFRATLDLNGRSLTALIVPGRDAAGRAFPLALCHFPGLPAAAAEAWCDDALPVALAALAGTLGADALAAALPPARPDAPPEPGFWRQGAAGRHADADAAIAALFAPVSSG